MSEAVEVMVYITWWALFLGLLLYVVVKQAVRS
jgi:hypothetical protein